MTDPSTPDARADRGHDNRRGERPPRAASDGTRLPVRAEDLEPYIGLRYVAKLFRVIAIILTLVLVAELVRGFYVAGADAIPTLLGEGSRLLVLAGFLWGAGDLAILMVDIGHDVRATRILMGRQAAHHLEQTTPPRGSPSAEPRSDR